MEQRLVKSLLKSTAYPEPTSTVDLLQTHVSYLFLTDSFVYKVKKPVDFGFLNFTTLDRRRFYCEEEVRLNRRLCPEIYLGVVEVRESATGAAFFGDGKLVDYAVKMKRLPEERMLSRLLAENRVTAADLQRIGRTVAEFHLKADHNGEIDSYGSIEAIRRNWEENFQQMIASPELNLSESDLSLLRTWVSDFLLSQQPLFARRVAGGFIRDCDGDLHADNICLTEQICIFDCIEFNERFRYSDTAADIAFLLMDLDFHQKAPLAEAFLQEYIEVTGDREVVQLLDFYKVYRAVVRGKVESFRFHDPSCSAEERQAAKERASRYFRLARGYLLRQHLPPSLIITCGLMGSGKSTIAHELAFELGIAIASSDLVRKELAAVPPTAHDQAAYAEGIYTPAYNQATYAKLLAQAETALRGGQSIIIDATFRSQTDRARFRQLAERLQVPFYIIQTGCSEQLVKERLEARQQNPAEVSDGRWELFYRQQAEFVPPTAWEGRHIYIDTGKSIGDNLHAILGFLGVLDHVA